MMDETKESVGFWKRIYNSLKRCWEPTGPDAIFSLIMRPVVLVVVSIGLVVWHYFDETETAKFAAYLTGGILLLAQVRASSKRAQAADDTVKLVEKGNIAERFKNAIEHLGNESASIRLGGIYALHHIAQDVEEYRERIFEILCAHIRETTTQSGYEPLQYSIKERQSESESGLVSPDRDDWLPVGKVKPSREIQSILKLLLIDSPGCDIYTEFIANLEHSDLKGTALGNTNLQDANFFNTNLNSALFDNAELQGANFEGADLQSANFPDASLQDTDFYDAALQGAYFGGADLQHAVFLKANLNSTTFISAELKRANFGEADLYHANFKGADLQNASFFNANLQGTHLTGTKNLTAEQLLTAKTLYQAELPEGMEAEIKQHKPELLDKPKPDNEQET